MVRLLAERLTDGHTIMSAMRKLEFVLLLATAAIAQKRPITHEDIWLMKRISEPAVSPDGRSIAFVLTEPDYDAAKQSADLWVTPADASGPPRRLTFTKAPETGPVWSPDSTRLAFVTRREGDEAAQVYVMPMSGGEAQRITSVPGGAANPQWRPDGKAILFESDYDPIAAERKQRKSNARIYGSMPVRFWNAWLDEKKPHIFTQELREGAQPVDVMKGSKLAESEGFGGVFNPLAGGQSLQPVWAPDGKSIVFAAYVNRNEMMSAEVYSALFAVPASGGEPRQLTENGPKLAKPTFSTKGDTLYAHQERRAIPGGRLYSLTRLARFSWPSVGKPTVITEPWDRSVSSFFVAADGRTV
jgi:dipeptidyl aminopeptidase/acylaminoacyl peptidase